MHEEGTEFIVSKHKLLNARDTFLLRFVRDVVKSKFFLPLEVGSILRLLSYNLSEDVTVTVL